MNILSANSINTFIRSWQEVRNNIEILTNPACTFPISVRGLQGAMYSYFTTEYCKQAAQRAFLSYQYTGGGKTPSEDIHNDSSSYDTIIVVPDESEADRLASDFTTVFPERKQLFFLGGEWFLIDLLLRDQLFLENALRLLQNLLFQI